MQDFFHLFRFGTDFPFGYLGFYIILGFVSVILFIIALREIKRQKIFSIRFVFSFLTLLLCGFFFLANFTSREHIEFNTLFSERDIVGTWIDEGSQLQLKKDGRAFLNLNSADLQRLKLKNGKAVWSRLHDFNIRLRNTPKDKNGPLIRVIKASNKYRLIIEDYSSLDLWDGDLGFRKAP